MENNPQVVSYPLPRGKTVEEMSQESKWNGAHLYEDDTVPDQRTERYAVNTISMTEAAQAVLLLVPRDCMLCDLTAYDALHDEHFPEIDKSQWVVFPRRSKGVPWVEAASVKTRGSTALYVTSLGFVCGHASTIHKVIGLTTENIIIDPTSQFVDYSLLLVLMTRTTTFGTIRFLVPDDPSSNEVLANRLFRVADPKSNMICRQSVMIWSMCLKEKNQRNGGRNLESEERRITVEDWKRNSAAWQSLLAVQFPVAIPSRQAITAIQNGKAAPPPKVDEVVVPRQVPQANRVEFTTVTYH